MHSQFPESKNNTKHINEHVSEEYFEESDNLRHSYVNKELYGKRKEIIERVFADMKENHGIHWTILRRKKKVSAKAMLVAAFINL